MSSPIIFEKGTRDFSTLGLGLLSDAIQATTTEELNGQFIFEMDYPASGNNADLIKENRIIVVNSGHILKRQGFIIRQIVRKIDLTMTVYAEHVSYATLDVALSPIGTISGDAKTALENWKRMLVPAVDFTVDSDILTTNSTLIGAPEFETARQGLGGHTGSILDVWGGEYQFDNWHIRLLKQRGKSANAIIAYGRNLISFEQDTNIADTYTSVYPYYQENSGDEGNKTHFLPERTVDSEFVGKYPNPKVLMLDLSNKFKDIADYSETKLRNYALSYIQSNNIGVPKVNMKISTVDLSRATGGFSEDIDLGDTVNVYFEKLGITTSAKIIKAVWNVLSDDYDKFEIGARRSSLTESISELATTADENANKALKQALVAQQSADGKTTIYYLNSSDPWPTNPNENDTAFVKDGENSIMYRYMFNNDTGVFSWVKILDSMSADQINQRVSDALESGKAYSDQLVADNVAQVNTVLDDVQAKQADLTAQQAELDTKAQEYANKALDDAKADTLATAAQTAKTASDALATAKTDLTTSLNKEVTDRTTAVTALDTKAKGYADTAKADAISASTTALNTAKTDLTTSITKEVTDRQKAITDLDAKSTGAINQAKTDAQSALDALQVGTRNLFLNSKTLWNVSSNGGANAKEAFDATTNMWHITSPAGSGINKGIYFSIANNTSTAIPVGQPWTISVDIKGTGLFKQIGLENSVTKGPTGNSPTDWTRVSATGIRTTANNVVMYFDATTVALDVYIKLPKLEQGTKATDWSPAPEDIVLDYTTKDGIISQSLTQYQSTNDGKVTKAQSDATQALGLVATKVLQTTFDTKTGDLDSKYTAVKQTADQAKTDIVAIKSTNTSQDTKINTLTSDVSGTKQSISDIQTEQGKQSTKINTIQTDVSGTKQDISDIQEANGVQDGKIASISTTVDGLSSSFSTYKTTNDGKVAKAQADITANATAISQKVTQSDYNAKTGQLQTDLNTTTTTANQAKTDIVAIKKTNTDQDTRMTTIESDANGIKTTVSSLQTTANTQAGSISTLQQRADGFDATVATLGQINQLFNTEFSPDFAGWVSGDSPLGKWDPSTSVLLQNDSGWALGDGKHSGSNVLKKSFVSGSRSQFSSLPIPVGAGQAVAGSIQAQSTTSYDGNVTARIDFRYYDSTMNYISMDSVSSGKLLSWTTVQMARTTPVNTAYIVYVLLTNGTTGNNYYSQPMLTFSNKVGRYVQGNYNNNASVAKAQLTADNASLALSNYKSDADGRISKAQADIIVNANAITQKVSQSDYNAKTGDLTTKVNTAQSTADSATSTIGSYKQTNDARVASAESKITANATAITQKVSQTDYNTKTGQIDGQISTINQTTAGITQSVADVTTQVNTFKQVNLVNNSQLALDYSGWHLGNPWGASVTTEIWNNGIADNGGAMYVWHDQAVSNLWLVSEPVPVNGGQTVSLSITAAMPQKLASGVPLALYVKAYDANKVQVSSIGYDIPLSALDATFRTFKLENKTLASTAKYVAFVLGWNAGGRVSFGKPMMVFGSTVGDHVPGQYVNNDKISTVSQTVDSISSIVSDPTTGLTKRVQTAEGTLSQVTGADIPALQKATYWQAPNGYDLNTYLTQGSTFFRDTTARTNAPTTSTKWMYLVVERTPNGDRVTQTAWYDTQTDAKITYRRQYAGTWGAWYANDNDSVATIAQTNGAIQTEISNRATGDTNTLTQAKDFTTSSITSSETGMRSQITQTSDAILAKIEATNMVVNSEFDPLDGTWYQITTGAPAGATVGTAWNAPQAGSFQDWPVINGSRIITYASANWYTSTLMVTSAGKAFSASIVAGRSPTPTVSTALDFRIAFWDGNRALIGTMSGGNIIDGTVYKGVQKYVVENKIAPANTKYVSVVIAHSSANATDFISRPALNVGATASPYTPTYGTTASSTVLSLLKDNWSIGIADNAGAITNGIVGNSTNMSLISNNVVINAPSTQIKGTAWINSAMIANGAIGKAQIGDASITSAKIASLDVAKLTGNVSSFIQSNWNGVFASTMIDNTGMSINGGNTTTKFDTSGAHYSNGSGISATYSFGKWSDQSGNATSATGLYLGATGSENSFINILGTNGAAALVLAGSAMDYGANLNVMQGTLNSYVNVNIRTQLHFKGNKYNSPSYIEINESNRTFNFFTGGGSVGGGNYFYFNQNVISAGTFSSTSVLSKKNVKSVYDEDALGEIAKTQLVNFEYKNRIGQNHISPIIDDVNSEKEYYIPKTILGQDNEYVDMYSMISMSWRAIQQLNEKIGDK
ncbi:phage tail spike protein [Leuconostoc lactis]|uniref:phage tail spike protein n=1 Tax=Leuconostoc lactis TaxID=1246 RepID=UPI0024AC9B20|nr:phage tail spike protein [Leuconostoc lactis]MDI6572771.1 phage tail spike protein [Leuconostoc lactis]